ncbi:hypothetical protein LTR53_004926 [Teratosphaeriaceae sp. CCFEE 6253]|nr:hypothetical protein LTR53_004926 [Teratosphaeriaceae sp. CCFEE 6253]
MYPSPPADMLPLLHAQHRYYTSELAATHHQLASLYRKLARIEAQQSSWLTLDPPSRKDKKKLLWTRKVTTQSVQKLELQQAGWQTCLRECEAGIAVGEASVYHLPATPWTAHLPPSPWGTGMFGPYSPVAASPSWAQGPPLSPQSWWGLSMLRRQERRQSSLNTTSSSSAADSGFYEPAPMGSRALPEALAAFGEGVEDPEHVFAHELLAVVERECSKTERRDSEGDDVPMELPSLPPFVSCTDADAAEWGEGEEVPGSKRRRRYSENAVDRPESRRLSVFTGRMHRRGVSVGPIVVATGE